MLTLKLCEKNLSDCETDKQEELPSILVVDSYGALKNSMTSRRPIFNGFEFE